MPPSSSTLLSRGAPASRLSAAHGPVRPGRSSAASTGSLGPPPPRARASPLARVRTASGRGPCPPAHPAPARTDPPDARTIRPRRVLIVASSSGCPQLPAAAARIPKGMGARSPRAGPNLLRDVPLDGHQAGVARAEQGVVAREHGSPPMIEPDPLDEGAPEATQDEQVETDADGKDHPRPWRVVARRLVVRRAVFGVRVHGSSSAAQGFSWRPEASRGTSRSPIRFMNRLSSVRDANSKLRPDTTCSTRPAIASRVVPDGNPSRMCTTKARWGSSGVGDPNRPGPALSEAFGRESVRIDGSRVMEYRRRVDEVLTNV